MTHFHDPQMHLFFNFIILRRGWGWTQDTLLHLHTHKQKKMWHYKDIYDEIFCGEMDNNANSASAYG